MRKTNSNKSAKNIKPEFLWMVEKSDSLNKIVMDVAEKFIQQVAKTNFGKKLTDKECTKEEQSIYENLYHFFWTTTSKIDEKFVHRHYIRAEKELNAKKLKSDDRK